MVQATAKKVAKVFRIDFRDAGGDAPGPYLRLRRLLKIAGRQLDLRCVRAVELKMEPEARLDQPE